jgi:hypothetical protein
MTGGACQCNCCPLSLDGPSDALLVARRNGDNNRPLATGAMHKKSAGAVT